MKAIRAAIVCYGDPGVPPTANPRFQRLAKVSEAFEKLGVFTELVSYNDETLEQARAKLVEADAILVWVNPIENLVDRTRLDGLLRELAAQGKFVSTHPDVILKLGTKEVLANTKKVGWSSDVRLYRSAGEMRREFPKALQQSSRRVLKQNRGHSGIGVWLVTRLDEGNQISEGSRVRVRQAATNDEEEIVELGIFMGRCEAYFSALGGKGSILDQAYQSRISEGMVRCYLVKGQVQGFGIQEVVALHPGLPGESVPAPTKRHYHPPTLPQFQRLKHLVENVWVPEAQAELQINVQDLPALWDCDFMFGPKDEAGRDTYILCEINVSCVSPFPESAAEPLAKAVMQEVL